MRFTLFCVLALSFLTSNVRANAWISSFDTRVETFSFEEKHEKKIEQALEIILKIVKSGEFMNKVIYFSYNGKREFVQNDGLNNFQIYLHILQGTEKLLGFCDAGIDMEMELWIPRLPTSTTGYTSPGTNRVWIKKSYLERASVAELAGTIFHEWLHKIGFDHDKKPTQRRPYSVPYAIGDIMGELAAKLTNQKKFYSHGDCFEKLAEEKLQEWLLKR